LARSSREWQLERMNQEKNGFLVSPFFVAMVYCYNNSLSGNLLMGEWFTDMGAVKYDK
jgi:hypothetical protein